MKFCQYLRRRFVCPDRNGNVVAMDLVEPIPLGAHTEDWLVGDKRPKLVKQLADDEYREACGALQENSTAPIEGRNAKRSLMMVHPEKITSFAFDIEENWEGQKRYTPRCTFRVSGRLHRDRPISDAEWRGYGRRHRKRHGGNVRVDAEEIFEELDTEDCWLTLGRNEMGETAGRLWGGIEQQETALKLPSKRAMKR